MRIVTVGENDALNIARFHEAFRDGLRRRCDTRVYGKGYPGWDQRLHRYGDIVKRVSPDQVPDLVIATYQLVSGAVEPAFEYQGFAELDAPKAVVLSDWWSIAGDGRREVFAQWIVRNGIDLVLCQYPGAVREFAGTSVADRCVWLPICIDPNVFNDWGEPLRWDVGMLGAGVLEEHSHYPERHAIHRQLASRAEWRYLTAPHPGYRAHRDSHPLIGRNFSRLINSCRAHVVTGGTLCNPYGKYFETLASRSLLVATVPEGAADLGLVDGETYVSIDSHNVVERLAWYLARPHLCERIATAGHDLAMRRHDNQARACDLVTIVRQRIGGRRVTTPRSVQSEPAIPISTGRSAITKALHWITGGGRS